MRVLWLLIAAIGLTASPAGAQAPSIQAPEATTPPEAPAFGRVSGFIRMSSGFPVAGARVSLTISDGSVSYAVGSRDDGSFLFEDVDPGLYLIRATKGADESLQAAPIAVGPGSEDEAELILAEFSLISGRVYDAEGDPAAGILVTAVSYGVLESGQRNSNRAVSAPTDAQGNYSIERLPPGAYFVLTDPALGRPPLHDDDPLAANPDSAERMVRTFYPNSLNRASAIRVILDGEHPVPQTAIDIRIRKERVYSVEGTVVDDSGDPLPHLDVQLSPAEGSYRFVDSKTINSDAMGRFDFDDLLPGQYRITAIPTTRNLQGSAAVSIGRQSISDLRLELREIQDLPVHVSKANGDPPGQRMLLTLRDAYGNSTRTAIEPDGYGLIEAPLAGPSGIDVQELPEGFYVQAIRYAGQDITAGSLDLANGVNGGLIIILEEGAATISGVLATPHGEPTEGIVTLLPDPSGPLGSVRGLQDAVADKNGVFAFDGVAPGNYVLTGWPTLMDPTLQRQLTISIYTDDAFRTQFRSQSERISVKPGASVYQTLEPLSPALIEQQLAIAP